MDAAVRNKTCYKRLMDTRVVIPLKSEASLVKLNGVSLNACDLHSFSLQGRECALVPARYYNKPAQLKSDEYSALFASSIGKQSVQVRKNMCIFKANAVQSATFNVITSGQVSLIVTACDCVFTHKELKPCVAVVTDDTYNVFAHTGQILIKAGARMLVRNADTPKNESFVAKLQGQTTQFCKISPVAPKPQKTQYDAALGADPNTMSAVFCVFADNKPYKYLAPPALTGSDMSATQRPAFIKGFKSDTFAYFYCMVSPQGNGFTLSILPKTDYTLDPRHVYVVEAKSKEGFGYFYDGEFKMAKIPDSMNDKVEVLKSNRNIARVAVVPRTYAERNICVKNNIAPGDVYCGEYGPKACILYTPFGTCNVPTDIVELVTMDSVQYETQVTARAWYRFYAINNDEHNPPDCCNFFIQRPLTLQNGEWYTVEATSRHSGLGQNSFSQNIFSFVGPNLVKNDCVEVSEYDCNKNVLMPCANSFTVTGFQNYSTRLYKNEGYLGSDTKMELWSPLGDFTLGKKLSDHKETDTFHSTTETAIVLYDMIKLFSVPFTVDTKSFEALPNLPGLKLSSTQKERKLDYYSDVRKSINEYWNTYIKSVPDPEVILHPPNNVDPPRFGDLFNPESNDHARVFVAEVATQYLMFSGMQLDYKSLMPPNSSPLLYTGYVDERTSEALALTLGDDTAFKILNGVNSTTDRVKAMQYVKSNVNVLIDAIQNSAVNTAPAKKRYDRAKYVFVQSCHNCGNCALTFKRCIAYAFAKRGYMRALATLNRTLPIDYEADVCLATLAQQSPIYNLLCQLHCDMSDCANLLCVGGLRDMHRVLPCLAFPLVNQVGVREPSVSPPGLADGINLFLKLTLGQEFDHADKQHFMYSQIEELMQLFKCFMKTDEVQVEKDRIGFLEGLGPSTRIVMHSTCEAYTKLLGLDVKFVTFYKNLFPYYCPVPKIDEDKNYLTSGALTLTLNETPELLCRMVPRVDSTFDIENDITNAKFKTIRHAQKYTISVLYDHVINEHFGFNVSKASCEAEVTNGERITSEITRHDAAWEFSTTIKGKLVSVNPYFFSKKPYVELCVKDGITIRVKLVTRVIKELIVQDSYDDTHMIDKDRQTLVMYAHTKKTKAELVRLSDGRQVPSGTYTAEWSQEGTTFTQFQGGSYETPEFHTWVYTNEILSYNLRKVLAQ